MKTRFSILTVGAIAFVFLLVCSGCSVFQAKDKTFEKAGMQITLTSAFYEKEIASQTAYYESTTAIVTALKEEKDLFPDFDFTIAQYTDLVLNNNHLSSEKAQRDGKEYMYFSYERSVSGKDFYYVATTHKAKDAYWLIQFACTVENKEKMTEDFFTWADSITFVDGDAGVAV